MDTAQPESVYSDVKLRRTGAERQLKQADRRILLPSENYIGSVLGGQFRFGPLIRHEWDGDVYSVTSLCGDTEEFEAKAFDLDQLEPAARRNGNRSLYVLSRRRLCAIDQAGKKFVVYRVPAVRPRTAPRQDRPVETAMGRPSLLPAQVDLRQAWVRATVENLTAHHQAASRRGAREKGSRNPKTTSGVEGSRGVGLREAICATEPAKEPQTGKKGKKRTRNRGLGKKRIPIFRDVDQPRQFLDNLVARTPDNTMPLNVHMSPFEAPHPLGSTRLRSNTKRLGRLEKKMLHNERQFVIVNGRDTLARKKLGEFEATRRQLEVEIAAHQAAAEDEQWNVVESGWTMRKRHLFAGRPRNWVDQTCDEALLEAHGVFTTGELDGWWRARMAECLGIVNGHNLVSRKE